MASPSNPAGAFIVLIAAIVAIHGVEGLILATFMAGIMLTAIGLLRLGTFIKYIPYPVTVGFTAGIAVIILASQVTELLGLTLSGAEPGPFIPKVAALGAALPTINPAAAIGRHACRDRDRHRERQGHDCDRQPGDDVGPQVREAIALPQHRHKLGREQICEGGFGKLGGHRGSFEQGGRLLAETALLRQRSKCRGGSVSAPPPGACRRAGARQAG